MSGEIEVPGHIDAFQDLETTSEGIETLVTDLRAVTVDVKNAHSDTAPLADPAWKGDAAEAHTHAATRFFVRVDVVDAALDKAVAAADRFERRINRLTSQRSPLETERLRINGDTADLVREIRAATDDTDEDEFRRRAAALRTRATTLAGSITDWTTRYLDAESDFVAALQAVDTLREGRRAESAPGRPDTTALRAALRRLADDPTRLAAWWAALSRAQKDALITEDPELVGNADGLPTRDRDGANRAALYGDLDYLGKRSSDGELTDRERSELANARTVADGLDGYREKVDLRTGRELAYLMVFKPGEHSGDGGVALSFGDPDTADNVSTLVPGFSTETSSLDAYLKRTLDLYDTAGNDANGSVASIFWLDYDAPSGNPFSAEILDDANVLTPVDAAVGGNRFADFVDGLHASDQGPAAHLTAIGHSYGSTTLGYALADGARVDDAILIGSPGQPLPTAHLETDAHVWVGSQDHDPVTLLGQTLEPRADSITPVTGALGFDPAQSTFGGTRFETGDGSLRVEKLFDNHSSYFSGESLTNMGHIVSGDDGAVTTRDERDGYGYLSLPELLGVSSGNSAGHAILDGAVEGGQKVIDTVRSLPGELVSAFDPSRWRL